MAYHHIAGNVAVLGNSLRGEEKKGVQLFPLAVLVVGGFYLLHRYFKQATK